jgi:iron complex transport system permease protein
MGQATQSAQTATPTVADAAAQVARGRRRRRTRATAVVIVLAALALAAVAVALMLGATGLTLPEVVSTLLGHGDKVSDFVVFRLRMPRATAAIIAGVCFGLAGALFQSTLRNPLASPDILGVTGGASLAAVAAMLLGGASGPGIAIAAFAGALAIAAAMWALAWRDGLVGYRFVLIGVALAAIVQAGLGWIITRADVRDASQALVWTVGGIGDVGWADITVAAIALAALLVLVALVSKRMPILALDDGTARSLGVAAPSARGIAIALGVALVAVGTALAGPVAFVALIAPPIARSLVRGGGAALAASALVGAVLVVVADLIGQYALPGGIRVPVGIVTGLVGAPYLLWLLARANRKGSDG